MKPSFLLKSTCSICFCLCLFFLANCGGGGGNKNATGDNNEQKNGENNNNDNTPPKANDYAPQSLSGESIKFHKFSSSPTVFWYCSSGTISGTGTQTTYTYRKISSYAAAFTLSSYQNDGTNIYTKKFDGTLVFENSKKGYFKGTLYTKNEWYEYFPLIQKGTWQFRENTESADDYVFSLK